MAAADHIHDNPSLGALAADDVRPINLLVFASAMTLTKAFAFGRGHGAARRGEGKFTDLVLEAFFPCSAFSVSPVLAVSFGWQ